MNEYGNVGKVMQFVQELRMGLPAYVPTWQHCILSET
jgi:hypothetical protein